MLTQSNHIQIFIFFFFKVSSSLFYFGHSQLRHREEITWIVLYGRLKMFYLDLNWNSLPFIVGYVPAIAYFSSILNQSCTLWSSHSAQYYHECALYDSFKHQVYFVSTVLVLKAISFFMHIVAYRFIIKGGSTNNMEWAEYDTIEMQPAGTITSRSRPSHLWKHYR